MRNNQGKSTVIWQYNCGPPLTVEKGILMATVAASLIATSAAITFLVGVLHLVYTFHGSKLLPRDAELHSRMQQVNPVITRQTTMWKAWIGFNASHSVGLILYGAVYAYLALIHPDFLFESVFLLVLGLITLLGYVVLAKQYFFRAPFRLVLLSSVLYILALVGQFV
jgi:hypothetical protein